MRYAVVSDIHANIQAWNAVLQDIDCSTVDSIICLGDTVGYGPRPAEVLQSVHAHANHMILGNHDAVVAGKLSPRLFNPRARKRIEWTIQNLSARAVEVLGNLPLQLIGDGFRCTHGEFSNSAAFSYIFVAEDAMPSWDSVSEPLLFVGHSHAPGIFLLGNSGTPRQVSAQDFALEPEKRYLVNVGSVGLPRDGDIRASYCIYDTKLNSVFWRRIPFDIEAYRCDLHAAGFEEDCENFLKIGIGAKPTVREQINFAPPSSPESHAKDVVLEKSLTLQLRRHISHWKIAVLSLTLALLISAGISLYLFSGKPPERISLPTRPLPPALFTDESLQTGLLPQLPAASGTDGGIEGWRVILDNKEKQSVSVVESDEGAAIELISSDPEATIRIEAPALRVRQHDKLQIRALFKSEDGYEGHIHAIIGLQRTVNSRTSSLPTFITVAPNPKLPRGNGWQLAQKTFEIPAGSELIMPAFEGKFEGRILITGYWLKTR